MKLKNKQKSFPERKLRRLDTISDLISEGNLEEAEELLESFSEKELEHPYVKSLYVQLSLHSSDFSEALLLSHDLQRSIRPGDLDHYFYIFCLSVNDFPALAFQEMTTFKQRTKLELSSEILNLFKQIDEIYLLRKVEMPTGSSNPDSVLAQHDICRLHIMLGDYLSAASSAQKLIAECPEFLPARNNLALLYFKEGENEKALSEVNIVLEKKPDYKFALNLKHNIEIILGIETIFPNIPLRLESTDIAETLGLYLRDFRFTEISEFLASIDYKTCLTATSFDSSRIVHYLAFAELSLGNLNKAKELWEYAETNLPMTPYVIDSINEIEDETYDIYAFKMNNILPSSSFHLLWDESLENPQFNFIKHYRLLRSLLLLGDDIAIESALRIIETCNNDTFDPILVDFIQGYRGNFEFKSLAMSIINKRKGPQIYRVYQNGEFRELESKITFPREIEYPEELEDILIDLEELFSDSEYGDAEKLIESSLKKFPDFPVLYNQLAVVKSQLGKLKESEEIISILTKKFPDYPTGQVNLGFRKLDAGLGEEAKIILDSLIARDDLHPEELEACNRLQRALAEKGFLPKSGS